MLHLTHAVGPRSNPSLAEADALDSTASRRTVLIVDDEQGPREALRMILKDEFRVLCADSAVAAAELVKQEQPDAVLLDIRLGRVDGIEALRLIRSIDPTVQVAMITAYASVETARLAMQLGAVDYLTKPFDLSSVRQVVRGLAARRAALDEDSESMRRLRETNEVLQGQLDQYRLDIGTNRKGTLEALIAAVDAKDRYTRDHSARVSLLSEALAEELSYDREEIRIVRQAGLIHDIGKIGVAESVLQKTGKLSADEWLEMKKHPGIGAEIISPVPALAPLLSGVLQHHERPDGKGYPAGLSGAAISKTARILSVADAIDAMSSDRIYSSRLSPDEIVEELQAGSGSQWASEVVDAAIRIRLPRRHGEFDVSRAQPLPDDL